jgi:hypothetical protein
VPTVQEAEIWMPGFLNQPGLQEARGIPKYTNEQKRDAQNSSVATQFTELDSRELGKTFTAHETMRWILYIKVGQRQMTSRMCIQNRVGIPEDAEP